jgi:hypothetical protein
MGNLGQHPKSDPTESPGGIQPTTESSTIGKVNLTAGPLGRAFEPRAARCEAQGEVGDAARRLSRASSPLQRNVEARGGELFRLGSSSQGLMFTRARGSH